MNEFAESWNFGPADEGSITVGEVVRQFKSHWDVCEYDLCSTFLQPHEAGLLKLDCSKAGIKLNWQPVWNVVTVLKKTVEWYKNYYKSDIIQTSKDLNDYIRAAQESNLFMLDK